MKYLIDIYVKQFNDKYECICDVPKEKRFYASETDELKDDETKINSMLIGFKTQKQLSSFENEFKNDDSILYAIGTEQD